MRGSFVNLFQILIKATAFMDCENNYNSFVVLIDLTHNLSYVTVYNVF